MPTTAEYRANYYQKNKERIDAQKREYNERSGFFKKYYEDNAEKLKQDAKDYYNANRDKIRAQKRAYYHTKKAKKLLEQEN